MNLIPIPNNIDHHVPYCGACFCCGHSDARHRMFDAILDRYKAGESVESLMDDYQMDRVVIEWVVKDYKAN